MKTDSNKQPAQSALKRKLNPMHVWAIVFGCVIGWGSFINPGKKFLSNSGVAGTAIAMVLGALVMIVLAFSYAYMVPKYPKAGGEFTFAKGLFGKHAAFLCGWFLGRLLERNKSLQRLARIKIPLLSAVGRKTIWVYMLHQPFLMGICMLLFGR